MSIPKVAKSFPVSGTCQPAMSVEQLYPTLLTCSNGPIYIVSDDSYSDDGKRSSPFNLSPAMGKDDYSSAGGGRLKIKGGGVDKHKKKKKRKIEGGTDVTKESGGGELAVAVKSGDKEGDDSTAQPEKVTNDQHVEEQSSLESSTMTAAERRYEEQRRKRVLERLEKEGGKSHKERVEHLNKYLSSMTEHHDF